MIRKFLVVGKQMYLTAIKRDLGSEPVTVTELLMPVETYWRIKEMLRKADYLIAAGDDPAGVAEIYRKVLKEVVNYGVAEKDRIWLLEKSKSNS
jgi:hypothetical protein